MQSSGCSGNSYTFSCPDYLTSERAGYTLTASGTNCDIDEDDCCKQLCDNQYIYGSLLTDSSGSAYTYYCEYDASCPS